MKTAMFLATGLLVSLFLLACSVETEAAGSERRYSVGGVALYDVVLDDGARCVVMVGYKKGALDCDFSSKPLTPEVK